MRYRREAKEKIYNFHEDTSIQFWTESGHKYETTCQEFARLDDRQGLVEESSLTTHRPNSRNSKVIGKLRHKAKTFMFWPRLGSTQNQTKSGCQSTCQNCPMFQAVLTHDLILALTGATKLRFGFTLYRFESETELYSSYEDTTTQFHHYPCELSMVRS